MTANNMKEREYQAAFLDFYSSHFPELVLIQNLKLKYLSIGSTSEIPEEDNRQQRCPNGIIDIIEIDENSRFHLWELKLMQSNELWSGKFYGQFLLYSHLFDTEESESIKSAIVNQASNKRLKRYGSMYSLRTRLDAIPKPSISSWNLLVCGGDEDEFDAGNNPILWTFSALHDEWFNRKQIPCLNLYQYTKLPSGEYSFCEHFLNVPRNLL